MTGKFKDYNYYKNESLMLIFTNTLSHISKYFVYCLQLIKNNCIPFLLKKNKINKLMHKSQKIQ